MVHSHNLLALFLPSVHTEDNQGVQANLSEIILNRVQVAWCIYYNLKSCKSSDVFKYSSGGSLTTASNLFLPMQLL